MSGYIFAVISLCGILARFLWTAARRASRFPPGPPGYLFIGHTVSALKREPFRVLARWGEQYGPLIFLQVLRKPIVVINSAKVADDLFNKRCGAFGDRPFRLVAHVCEYDKSLAFMSLGDRLKQMRRQLHDALNARAIPHEHSALEAVTHKFILKLLQTPDDLHKHIRFFYIENILSFTLGYHAESEEDELVVLSENVGRHAMTMMTPSVRFMAELVPLFRYLPIWMAGPSAAKTMYTYRNDLRTLLARSDDCVTKCKTDPEALPSFLSKLLHPGISEEEKNTATYSAVSLYGGAVDTTISLTTSYFLAMMVNPEAQAKAQDEIDRVVGRHRLPTFADRPSLPYTEALITELWRWAPPIPLTSRVLPRDEPYEEYVLPRGSTVTANIWAMMHDKALFTDPDDFRPERFYSSSPDSEDAEELAERRRNIRHIVFGFGRRVCPGRFYADAWLWIAITSILASMRISRPDGKTIPETRIEEGAIIQLCPFPCKLEPRFHGVTHLASNIE